MRSWEPAKPSPKGLFDNIDHELLLRAVRKHVTCKWALLYIERWLKAPMMREDGVIMERSRGTPQGGVITPRTQKVISAAVGTAGAPIGRRDAAGRGRWAADWDAVPAVPDDDGVITYQNLLETMRRTMRCRSRMSSVSAALRSRVRNAVSVSASRMNMARSPA